MDERIIKNIINKEISIGNYIINCGEFAAIILIDTINRMIKNTSKPDTIKKNTFENNLFDYPNFTKPIKFKKLEIPKILQTKNKIKTNIWKKKHAIKKTYLYRPDLKINRDKII